MHIGSLILMRVVFPSNTSLIHAAVVNVLLEIINRVGHGRGNLTRELIHLEVKVANLTLSSSVHVNNTW
jgi:hypothetical protein